MYSANIDIQGALDDFSLEDTTFPYNGFVARLYNFCRSLGFEPGKILPSRAFCSDETQGYPGILIAKHFGTFPFNHGRGFAAMRVKNKKYWQKISYAGIALLLPLIQIGRIFAHLVNRRRYILKFFQVLPWITMFSISWSAGELVGYLSGPGQSLNQWH